MTSGRTHKALADWTRAEVQRWLAVDFEDGAWEPFAGCFSRYSGASLADLTEDNFIRIVKRKAGDEAEAVGIALFHAVQRLKQQDQLSRPCTATPPQQPTVADLSTQLGHMSLAQAQQWMVQLSALLTGDLELKKPHQLRNASEVTNAKDLGEAMPLVAREDVLHQLYDVSLRQFDHWNNRALGSPDLRKDIQIPTCCGASGIGKTRFSSQAFYLMHERIQAGAESVWRSSAPMDSDVARFRSALSRCVQKELVLEINATEDPAPAELERPMVSIGLRALYAYCQRYRPFCTQYPSYNAFFIHFWNLALASQSTFSSVLGQIADWEQLEEGQYLLLVIHIDETNQVPPEYINGCVRAITYCWHLAKSIHVFALPLLSGTNPADVYKISGEGPMNLQLPLLGVDDYITILQGLLKEPDYMPSEPVKRLLADLAYNPRLLAVGLSAMSIHGYAVLKQQQQGVMSKVTTSPRPGLSSLPFNLESLKAFLASAGQELCSMAFKSAVANLHQANLLTLDYWRDEEKAELRQLVLAHIVLDMEVSLTKKLVGVTVGELINQGVVFLDGGRYLMLPYAYLYVLFRDTTQSSRGRTLQLLGTPTRRLSPDDNETMDINTALYRLDLYRLAGRASCTLSHLLGLSLDRADDLQLQVPERKVELQQLSERMTFTGDAVASFIANAYDKCQLKRQTWAIINAPKAPSFDSAIFMTVALGSAIPDCYFARHSPSETDAEAVRALRKIQQMATFQHYRFDRPVSDLLTVPARNHRRLALFIQSKRRTSLAKPTLSKQEIWKEYLKVSGFAEILPFVLVIITDKHATVPTKLTKQVKVITDEELDAFFGRILAGRRRESSS